MNFTEITKWCDDHPDAYVDIHISLCKLIGKHDIKLKMQRNHSPIYSISFDFEKNFGLTPTILDQMYEKCCDDQYIIGCAGEDIEGGDIICEHTDGRWYKTES